MNVFEGYVRLLWKTLHLKFSKLKNERADATVAKKEILAKPQQS